MDSKNICKLGIILLLICAISTSLLSLVNSFTLPVIEENNLKAQELAKKEVLPLAENFEEISDGVYKGTTGNEFVGYTVNATTSGYGGAIEMIVGIDKDMAITGVKILTMAETPGLGAKAKDGDFINQFVGKKDGLKLKKSQAGENEINAISGATVTSTAVTNGVLKAFEMLKSAGGGK